MWSPTWSRAIEPERRREGLSWSHHHEVAHLDPAQQDVALSLAEGEGWSWTDLRERLHSEAEAA
jgi:hypothetical protein